MSVHKEGKAYRVKWKDHNGRQRSRSFTLKGDADTFDREIKRAKQLGPHLMIELQRSADTLDDFIRGPWRAHGATLAPKTRAKYRWVFDHHLGALADEPLVTIDVARLTEHQRGLLDNGVAPNTVREILRQIAGVLQIAVEHGRLPANPARSMRKVKGEPVEPIVPLSPAELEALIAAARGRDRAILVLGGYLGLRPIEIRLVPWSRLRGDRFTIAKVDTKPSAGPRTIDVPAAALAALREWRLEAGRPADSAPIVTLGVRNLYEHNGRLQRFALDVIGRDDLTLYTLRHSHASALHYAGFTVPEAARRMGHSSVVHLRHYAHVIDALGRERYPDLDALIVAARKPAASERFRLGSVNG